MERKQNNDSAINEYRSSILHQCRSKSSLHPGFFSLTVPTGGGKTLSSMAFALEHALRYDKRRIIMAIPYTSIIEQTAKVYKYGTDCEDDINKAIETGNVLFGEDSVLEHHSNTDPEKENNKSRIASENWDSPIIVTTNVQFFESLFASRGSTCRKLHNIVNSVVILDEAQMLPSEYLKPILSVLRGLVEHFGVTVILCTATQPSLCGKIGHGLAEFNGLENVTKIVESKDETKDVLKRVEISLPKDDKNMEWKDLASELCQYRQVLCIVNTRRHCRDLHSFMPDGTIHLSANMCGEERGKIISKLKQLLKNDSPVRVISTQLVEAGVDIDFPVVYRALAGMDSIAQAAGRCNREAKLNKDGKLGKVVVFNPPEAAPVGLLRKGEDAAKNIIHDSGKLEFTDELFSNYFKRFYNSINDFDVPKFYDRLVHEAGEFKFQFRTFAGHFNLIDGTVQKPVIVRYCGETNDSNTLLKLLEQKGPEPWLLRKLQRFVVNVPIYVHNKLAQEGHIAEIHGYWAQQSSGLYRPGYGLLSDISDWDNEWNFV